MQATLNRLNRQYLSMKYIVIKDDKLDSMAETIVSNILDAMTEEELALVEEIRSNVDPKREYELDDDYTDMMFEAIDKLNEYLVEEIVARAFGIIRY